MNTKINKIITNSYTVYADDINELKMTATEESYFYKRIDPSIICYEDRHKYIDKLLQYDNLFLMYDIDIITPLLKHIDVQSDSFNILLERYVNLICEFHKNIIPDKFVETIQYNVDAFINIWHNNKAYQQYSLKNTYSGTLEIMFLLLKHANIYQTKILSNVINEFLHNADKNKYVDSVLNAICVSHIIEVLPYNGYLNEFDIDYKYINNENTVYRNGVNSLPHFIRFLNLYNKYWDVKTAKQWITNRIIQVKVHEHRYRKSYILEYILNNVVFNNQEIKDAINKMYAKEQAKIA